MLWTITVVLLVLWLLGVVGVYTIGSWIDHPRLGRMVAFLTPDAENQMFGRGDFYIHGASVNPEHYGQESKGCIVLPHTDRQIVKDSGETRIQVTA